MTRPQRSPTGFSAAVDAGLALAMPQSAAEPPPPSLPADADASVVPALPESAAKPSPPFFAARGIAAGKRFELACRAFGARMTDDATAIAWDSGLILLSCQDMGFTLTMTLDKVSVRAFPMVAMDARSKLQLAATSPLCGVSTWTAIDDWGGARGTVVVSRWRREDRQVTGSFSLAWKTGCGGPGQLEGEFDVVLFRGR